MHEHFNELVHQLQSRFAEQDRINQEVIAAIHRLDRSIQSLDKKYDKAVCDLHENAQTALMEGGEKIETVLQAHKAAIEANIQNIHTLDSKLIEHFTTLCDYSSALLDVVGSDDSMLGLMLTHSNKFVRKAAESILENSKKAV